MNRLRELWRTTPRAYRWLALFGAFMLAFFVVIDPILARTAQLNAAADQLATRLAEQARVQRRVDDAAPTVRAGAEFFGSPAKPGTPDEVAADLEACVNQVLSAHRPANQRLTYRDPVEVTGDDLAAILRGLPAGGAAPGRVRRIERLVVEISFESDLAGALAVLRDLEAAPEVSGVSRVGFRTLNTGRRGGAGASGSNGEAASGPLQVTLSAEAWAVGEADAPRGATRESTR